ncbi:peptidoglycan-binding domain-containing protein [Deinococcus xianganensis]|uniref:Peptidoglycan binding-like domain-containing protein n=1 Tax=Deinococcus xianganensis TaxID=1507289 RepID=A0A6I4YMW3_9DEIO|nr:peptidoglycan-binding domain-containing protein [Deinococcus xianganensis]MXV18533.1 hypothetical protein [Deinococcus xianganensis]
MGSCSGRAEPTLSSVPEPAPGARQLAARGYAVTVDGSFGPSTESAVKSFQTSKGLTADGIVGPNTWLALES